MPGDQTELEYRIKSEQKKFEAVFYGSEAPMVIFKGPDAVVEMLNDKYQDIYRNRHIQGISLFKAIPELAATKFPGIVKNVLETGEHYVSREGLASILNIDTQEREERYFDTTFARIDFGNGDYRVLATPREVTERVMARKKLEESLKDLEDERELRERFVSGLSHDLRTPLAIVTMCALILKRKVEDTDSIIEMAERITSSAARADRMIRDLLDANRIKSGVGIPLVMQECNLDQIVQYVISDLEELYGKRFKFYTSGIDAIGYWDQMAIHRIIENLAANAIKYGTPYSDVSLTLKIENNNAVISVHNSGNPISNEEQNIIFGHFTRIKSTGSYGQIGWGIGLALVKGLTEAHKGNVQVESSVENGTTFFIQLPLDCRA